MNSDQESLTNSIQHELVNCPRKYKWVDHYNGTRTDKKPNWPSDMLSKIRVYDDSGYNVLMIDHNKTVKLLQHYPGNEWMGDDNCYIYISNKTIDEIIEIAIQYIKEII